MLGFLTRFHTNIYLMLSLAFLLGLILPGAEYPGAPLLKIIMSAIIFVSCFKVKLEHFTKDLILLALKFWILRFIFLPLGIFFLADYTVADLAPAVLIIALAPAGVSSVALVNLLGGNATLSMILVVLSSITAPVIYTVFSGLLLTTKLELDLTGIFIELTLLILAPVTIFVLIKKLPKASHFFEHNSSSFSTYLISALLLFAVALKRDAFSLSYALISDLIVLTVVYTSFYAVILLMRNYSVAEKISLSICSGVNNNALAMTLAASFFSSTELRFNVLSEVQWFLGILLFTKYCKSSYPEQAKMM